MEQPAGRRPEFRWTALALTGGTVLAGAALLTGLALTLLGADTSGGDPRRLDQVLLEGARLRPWGWSMLGVLLLLVTPAAGLLASFAELRPHYPRTALLALVVLVVLAAAAMFAFSAIN